MNAAAIKEHLSMLMDLEKEIYTQNQVIASLEYKLSGLPDYRQYVKPVYQQASPHYYDDTAANVAFLCLPGAVLLFVLGLLLYDFRGFFWEIALLAFIVGIIAFFISRLNASAAAMGFGAEISTREEKCTLIPSHDRAWCPLPRSQTRNIPGNASLWTRITPSNATHSRERVATDLHTHAHFAQHSRERVAYLSYAMQKAARLVGRPEAYSRVSAAHPRSLAHCCLVLA